MARHAAGRLDGVTAAADRCAAAVADKQAIRQDVAAQMKQLRTSLSELLHARVAELDRRTTARVAVRLPARLEYAGGFTDGELCDISPGGAHFIGAAPGVSSGQLVVNGLPNIAVTVVAASDGLHLAFAAASDDEHARIERAVGELTGLRPAA